MKATGRLILALDGVDSRQSVDLMQRLGGVTRLCKVGPALFHSGGRELLERLGEIGVEVFLDLKFHDIPQTVFSAVRNLCAPPVRFLTIHALGGPKMMRRAVEAVREAAGRNGSPVDLLAVTILTSLGPADLPGLGIDRPLEEETRNLALLARDSGLQGIVCSGREAGSIRTECGNRFLIVTPGVRPAGGPSQDQVRTVTPAAAIRAGADFLVVGRPIMQAADPVAAAREIDAEIETARQARKER